jgi:hypothetical protein
MSHDLCLHSTFEEFPLIGNPDAETPGLGRSKVFSGNACVVVAWYEGHCRDLGWEAVTWAGHAYLEESCLVDNDYYTAPPAWADPDPVARHIAMINAFLAFAPGAKFGAS